ncbi:thioredoxin-like protein [Corynespora cassiicola Philippines]|uniref:Thioredoxin-like protein n=1 Tax=Corynespora cassiicola Philippines TaxID=1448308 RepID=A0A2T2N7B1_CORCC|nr:thioredoxin-like protein [Corynespora cassiicola Philippines]
MTNFDIKIVSDTVCPWCYVGKKRLEKAVAAYKEKHPDSNDTFSMTWYPFYLQPDAPKQGIDKNKFYVSRFGEARAAIMFQRLGQLGHTEGINFKFGGKTGNTRDSHRLVQLGKTKGPQMQTRVIEELFAAYFENEKDITSRDHLIDAGAKAGLDRSEVAAWLDQGKGGKEVDKEVQDAYAQNISGVPNFTINDRFEVGGAQEPEAFLQLFERLKRQEAAGQLPAGNTC